MGEFLLSVIIPVYNTKDFLETAVASVTVQAPYKTGKAEIILVDDASGDGSGEICDRLADTYSNVRVLHLAHGGLSAARNAGIRAAGGAYLQFLDSDDKLCESALTDVAGAVTDEPDVLICRYNTVNAKTGENGECPYRLVPREVETRTGESLLRYLVTEREFNWYAWQFVIRRDFLIDGDLFFPEGQFFEDVKWSPRILYAAWRVAYLEPPVYNYVIYRPTSITNTVTPKIYEDRLSAITFTYNFCSENAFSEETRNMMLGNISTVYVSLLADYFAVRDIAGKDCFSILKKYDVILKYSLRRYRRVLYYLSKIIGLRTVARVLALRADYVRKKFGTS